MHGIKPPPLTPESDTASGCVLFFRNTNGDVFYRIKISFEFEYENLIGRKSASPEHCSIV